MLINGHCVFGPITLCWLLKFFFLIKMYNYLKLNILLTDTLNLIEISLSITIFALRGLAQVVEKL